MSILPAAFPELRAALRREGGGLTPLCVALWATPTVVTATGRIIGEAHWLSDTIGTSGEARFNSQYWRSNIDPSERYVQAITGTSQYRLKTDQSGFNNLLLTGDWILNGFNMGCVESATLSGMQTANAIITANKSSD